MPLRPGLGILVALAVAGVFLVPTLPGAAAAPTSPAPPRALPTSALPLPNPVSYSAMGDSITTGYDSNGSVIDLGEQPYYSYAVGWNTSVLSFYERLERLYGYGTITTHLLAVPGDKASDMIGQSLEAVANHSGFVTVLIGGNDVCDSSGGTPTPTPVWNFSASLNHTFRILRHDLPASTVISLGNVVNVSELWTLFGGDTQAEEVWDGTCPALLTAQGRADIIYMVKAYNHVEESIARTWNLTLWDIGNLTFSAEDVNHLDFFHPSPQGHEEIAEEWWAVLPYATMLPRFTAAPALPAAVDVGTSLTVQAGVQDVTGPTVTVTYQETGALFWSTLPLAFTAGLYYNGTYSATLPFNATAVAGTLRLYLTAEDVAGYVTTWPAQGALTPQVIEVVNPGATASGTLTSLSLQATASSLTPGGTSTLTATPACTGGPCPSAVAYAWSVSPSSAGQILPLDSGAEALFVAGTASVQATVWVNASVGVATAGASQSVAVSTTGVPPSVPPAAPGATPAVLPGALQDVGDVVLVAVALFLATMAAVGVLLRRRYLGSERRSQGSPPTGGSPSAPEGGAELEPDREP